MRRARRLAFWPLLLLVAHALAAAKTEDLESIPEIRQLQGILRATTDRDSVRLLLARAYRETGTMEGRERALDLFHRIRPRYYDDYRYHQELALTYLEGERYDDARESMRKAAQRAPDAIRVRGDLAELMFRHALRTCEADAVKELLGMLNETLALAPHDRTALLYKSLALSLARSLDPSRGSESSLEARACTEAILRGDPTDRLALLLQGAQCLDLGEPERADRWFRRGLELSSPVYGAAFFVPVLCAPEAVLRQLAEAPPSLRDSLSTAFWDSRDPTPLTPVNENLLEYWKRLVLADLFFGQPENSLRGWQTPRGELFVRYGPPEAMSFARASFAEGEATVQRDLPLERRRSREVAPMTLRFQCPEQTWRYTFGGREIAFAFIDPTLHDRFIAASPGVVETFTRTAPAVLTEGFHGNIRNCFLGSAGTRGDGGRTRQAVVVGLPAGDATTDPWAGARIDVRLLDQVGHEQSSELHTVSVRSAQPLPLGVSLALIAEELLLAPGRYTAEVRVAAGARAGTYALPVEVRTFGRDSLQLSDLRLAFAAERADSGSGPQGQTTPNPTGLVPRGARLGVAFEVYNLFPAAGDRARYQVRYTVLPLAYAREYSRLLASGNRARDPVLQFGRLGGTFGGVTLEDGNYADVLFPPIETPLAPAARCRSSFRLETAGLREGTYALLVTVTDLNVNRMVSVRAPFSVLSEAAFRAALAVE